MFINKKLNCVRLFLIMPLLFLLAGSAYGYVQGVGYTGRPCAPGYSSPGEALSADPINCAWRFGGAIGSDRARILWGAGQEWFSDGSGGGPEYTAGFESGYPPLTGNFRMRAHFCPSTIQNSCYLSKSAISLDSVRAVYLVSSIQLLKQNPDFADFNGIVPFSANSCLVYLDEEGVQWRAKGEIFCADARLLPNNPAFCYLNFGNDLAVDMGVAERNTIPAGLTGNGLMKEVKIICTRDAGSTVKVQFQYTPISISGIQTVKTQLDKVGIAMTYNDNIITPGGEVVEKFAPGYTTVRLGFELVHDPSQKTEDIPTGNFSATVVMIMTQQ